MKNREKYRDEILEALAELFKAEDNIKDWSFMKKHVISNYDLKKRGKEGTCIGLTCIDCAKMFAFWLDEECEEPPKPEVDWNKVPVDTLVRVRDYETDNWKLRYFAGFFEYDSLKYATWNSGRTSKTANEANDFMCWRYCELVEDEDDGSN